MGTGAVVAHEEEHIVWGLMAHVPPTITWSISHAAHCVEESAIWLDAVNLDHVVLAHALHIRNAKTAVVDGMKEWPPDIDLSNAALEGPSGFDVCGASNLRNDCGFRHVEVDLLCKWICPLAILRFFSETSRTTATLVENDNFVNAAFFATEDIADELDHFLIAIDVLNQLSGIPFGEVGGVLLEAEAVLLQSEMVLEAANVVNSLWWAMLKFDCRSRVVQKAWLIDFSMRLVSRWEDSSRWNRRNTQDSHCKRRYSQERLSNGV